MRDIYLASFASMCRGLAYAPIWIFSAVYIHSYLHLTYLSDGFVFTGGGILSMGLQFYSGVLTDRIPAKKIILLSYASIIMLFGLAELIPAIRTSGDVYSIWIILMMAVNGLQSSPLNVLISRISTIKLKGFSILRIGNNIGWGLGPAFGGFLVGFMGFQILFLYGFILSIVSIAIMALVHEKPTSLGQVNIGFTGNRAVLILSLTALLLFMVQSQETVTLSNYARSIADLSFGGLGLVYFTNGTMVALTQGLIYRVSKRIGNYFSYLAGTLIYSAGFLSYGFDINIFQFVASTAILTIGEDLSFPTGSTMVTMLSRPENIGKNMGIFNAFISFGRSIGPLIGGFAFTITSSPLLLWALVTVYGFASSAIFALMFRKDGRILEPHAVPG
ncbi:MAG: MFS transporter [Thermoplasmataceae archaeon]